MLYIRKIVGYKIILIYFVAANTIGQCDEARYSIVCYRHCER